MYVSKEGFSMKPYFSRSHFPSFDTFLIIAAIFSISVSVFSTCRLA